MKLEDVDLLNDFTPEQVARLDEIISRYKDKPGGLIPVLEEAQVALEYLPIGVQKRIAKGLNLPLSRVYGVVTFYSFFTMTPRGRHTVRVCLGTACYVRGGKAIAEHLVKEFGIKEKETTESGAWGHVVLVPSSSSTRTSMAGSSPSRSKKYSVNIHKLVRNESWLR
jgi:NADH:ubiquinone oxidoreductase subunit E